MTNDLFPEPREGAGRRLNEAGRALLWFGVLVLAVAPVPVPFW